MSIDSNIAEMDSSAVAGAPPARKYTFERVFDDLSGGKAAREREKPKPTFTEEQMAEACDKARAEGVSQGRQAEAENDKKRLATALEKLEARMSMLSAEAEGRYQSSLSHMRDVALAMVRKLFPAYAARHGLDEIRKVISDSMASAIDEPRIVVRVSEKLFEDASAMIEDINKRLAYAGKTIVLAEEGLGESDCRVEWADGGMERKAEDVFGNIEEAVAKAASPRQDVDATRGQTDQQGEQ